MEDDINGSIDYNISTLKAEIQTANVLNTFKLKNMMEDQKEAIFNRMLIIELRLDMLSAKVIEQEK